MELRAEWDADTALNVLAQSQGGEPEDWRTWLMQNLTKVLAHPASVDTINTCENAEDHVSMGALAADKARKILENAERVVAIELLTAWQALHFHRPLHREAGLGTQRLFAVLEQHLDFTEQDRVLYPLMEKATRLLRRAVISDCVVEFTS